MSEHHQQQYPTPQPPYDPYRIPTPPPNPRNGLGVAGLVLAVVGTLFGFFPITFIPALACAFAALVLVILAWVMVGRGRARKPVTIVASAFTALSLALGVWGGATFISTLDQLGRDLDAIGNGTSAAPTASATDDEATDEPTEDVTDEPTGPSHLAMGDQLPIEGDDGTEGGVTLSGPKVRTGPAVAYGSAPANGRFLIFTVKMECTSGTYTVDSGDFYVRDKDGNRYDVDDGNAWEATTKEQVSYEEMNAGEHKNGVIAFDVAKRHGELVYDPNYDGEPIAVWEF